LVDAHCEGEEGRGCLNGRTPSARRPERTSYAPISFRSGLQRCASQIRENEESGGSIARRGLAEYRVQTVLTQVRLANMPGEGPTLGSNRYSPEQGELVEQRASAVSDTGERIVANRDREVSLLV